MRRCVPPPPADNKDTPNPPPTKIILRSSTKNRIFQEHFHPIPSSKNYSSSSLLSKVIWTFFLESFSISSADLKKSPYIP